MLLLRLAALLMLTLPAVAISAQDRLSGGAARDALPMELVGTGLYLIPGGGGNSLARLTGAGIILIDGKLRGNYAPLVASLKKYPLEELPIRVLVITDSDERHTGTDAQFQRAGVPIIAQDNVRKYLAARTRPGGKVVLPTLTFHRKRSIRMGGVTVELLHFGDARTNGDTVVYFPGMKVVDVGELYTSGAPDVDFTNGGSLVGWSHVLSQVSKLDFDKVVTGAGPIATRAQLQAFKTKLDTLVSHAVALVRRGVPKDRLMDELGAEEPGWHFDWRGEQLDRFYAEMTEAASSYRSSLPGT